MVVKSVWVWQRHKRAGGCQQGVLEHGCLKLCVCVCTCAHRGPGYGGGGDWAGDGQVPGPRSLELQSTALWFRQRRAQLCRSSGLPPSRAVCRGQYSDCRELLVSPERASGASGNLCQGRVGHHCLQEPGVKLGLCPALKRWSWKDFRI